MLLVCQVYSLIFIPAQLPTPVPITVHTHSRAGELPAPRRLAKHGLESVDTSLPPLQVGLQGGMCPLLFSGGPHRPELQ